MEPRNNCVWLTALWLVHFIADVPVLSPPSSRLKLYSSNITIIYSPQKCFYYDNKCNQQKYEDNEEMKILPMPVCASTSAGICCAGAHCLNRLTYEPRGSALGQHGYRDFPSSALSRSEILGAEMAENSIAATVIDEFIVIGFVRWSHSAECICAHAETASFSVQFI